MQQLSKKVRALTWQLCGHVVNGADQNSRTLEGSNVLVPVRIIKTEWIVYCGALIHEFYTASRVSRDITDSQHPVWENRTSGGGRKPRDLLRLEEILGVRDGQ
jgi:hypothetical protein